MTIDSTGRVYVATQIGLQVFDPQGRLVGIIDKPEGAWLANADFAGPDLDTLYVTAATKVFKRKINAKGLRYFDAKNVASSRSASLPRQRRHGRRLLRVPIEMTGACGAYCAEVPCC